MNKKELTQVTNSSSYMPINTNRTGTLIYHLGTTIEDKSIIKRNTFLYPMSFNIDFNKKIKEK